MKTRALFAILTVALASAVAGCKNSCRVLAEQLCQCSATTALRDACLQKAANEDSRIGPTAADQATCKRLIPTCDCHTIGTPQGKVACGLAREPDAGLAGP